MKIVKRAVDFLVVGGGTAGCMAAIKAKHQNPDAHVLVLEKANIRRSGAIAMGMDGVNTAVIPGNSTPEQYVKEITIANDGILDQKCVLKTGELGFSVIQELEERSATTQKEVAQEYVQERKDQAKWRVRRLLTNERDTHEQNATADARQLMGRVMERISVSGHLERLQNTITFTNPKTKDVFADPESPPRKILHEFIDFRLEESKTKNSLLVRGDDPLGRENRFKIQKCCVRSGEKWC